MTCRRERVMQNEIRLALGEIDWLVFFRNNVGGTMAESGNFVSYGLATGSSDLIGIVLMESGIGRFCALEIKSETGRVSAEQKQWAELVRRYGGFYAVIRSVEEAIDAIDRCRAGDFE